MHRENMKEVVIRKLTKKVVGYGVFVNIEKRKKMSRALCPLSSEKEKWKKERTKIHITKKMQETNAEKRTMLVDLFTIQSSYSLNLDIKAYWFPASSAASFHQLSWYNFTQALQLSFFIIET